MLKKLILFVSLLILIGGVSYSNHRNFAYLLRHDPDGKNYLVQFDADKDEISKLISIPRGSGYENFIIDEIGGCYISKYATVGEYYKEILYYDISKNKIESFIKFRDIFGPRYMALTEKELMVEVRGSKKDRGKSGLIFIDRKTKKITNEIYIEENNPEYTQANINDIYFDEDKYIFLTSFFVDKLIDFGNLGDGDIYIIDIEKKNIIKRIDIPKIYHPVDGIFNYGDKIYAVALSKGKRIQDASPSNTDLLVYSLSKGTLLKKIKVSPMPYKLIYDKSVSKLYVQHMYYYKEKNFVEIINPKTDKIIGRIDIPNSNMFSLVRPGKIYISVPETYISENNIKPPKLLVLDTKSDKIIKTFPGNYFGISTNPKY